jgi:hypothetical protein
MELLKRFSIKNLMFCAFVYLSFVGFCQDYSSENLKALLIVGSQEDGTQKAIEKIESISQLFEAYGIETFEFYDDAANWEDIVKIAPECSFLVYCGHGSDLGKDGNAGGFVINSFVSTEEIQDQLKLKQNAVVVFQSVCNGAGSSAGDDGDIGVLTAKNRVYHYAYPFFDIGASVYYANNYTGGCKSFIKNFLDGKSVQDCYNSSLYSFITVEFQDSFSGYLGKDISVASSKPSGTVTRTTYTNGVKKVEQIPACKSYDIAFAGDPDLVISSLFP